MKILHTADWHIGKRLDNYSRLEEQRLVLAEICQIAETENVDAVVVAGDLFDNFNPSSEATELLYSTLHRLSANGSRAVIAIAGNHDSPERIQVPDALAKVCGIIFVGFPNIEIAPFCTQAKVDIVKTANGFIEIELPNANFPLRILHTPYANEQRLKTFLGVEDSEEALREHLQAHWQEIADKYLDNAGFNMLVTHLFVMKRVSQFRKSLMTSARFCTSVVHKPFIQKTFRTKCIMLRWDIYIAIRLLTSCPRL